MKNALLAQAKLIDAVRVIEGTVKRLAVVLSDDEKVIGTLTDGDIRRRLLQGGSLEDSVVDAMNQSPVCASVHASNSALREALTAANIRSLPLVDAEGAYVRTLYEKELTGDDARLAEQTFSAAIIMAGGEGTRLRPLTDKLPKPMVEIDGIPLIERQVRRLCTMGIVRIFISVNYLGEIIKNHFGDGSEFGVDINYLQEDKKLGTAGALSLLPDFTDSRPLLVMNGDVLTNSDFVHLYHFHIEHKAKITVCAVNYNVQIPYGVIQSNGVKVTNLQEKPSQQFFCNAGIYALSVSMLREIPPDTFWNMTDLIEQCLASNEMVAVFPVHEYWSDIGTPADLEKAREEFTGT